MSEQFLPDRFRAGIALMPYRIREVLLVSSDYDAFILEEDGYLTERVFADYQELNITAAPRVTHASSAESALDVLQTRSYDLVITMRRVLDMDMVAFADQVKGQWPRLSVVLLALDDRDLIGIEAGGPIDAVFVWTGDSSVLVAIVKLIEDRRNVEHDLELADIRVIVVVEDSVRYYSRFLAVMYAALLSQSHTLLRDGLNYIQRLRRVRTRPKVLLAKTYEEAVALVDKYENNILALISDIRYPREGHRDPEAGYRLSELVRNRVGQLPILLQSADPQNRARTRAINATFLHKNSPSLLQDLQDFLSLDLGFGPFVFRQENGTALATANDISELREIIRWVSGESLRYHVRHNHISTWLLARGEFTTARAIRFRNPGDMDDDIEVRKLLMDLLAVAARRNRSGVISDYAAGGFDAESPFTRLGEGSVGGKARGIAFLNAILVRRGLSEQFSGMPITVPQTVVICTDFFDTFLDNNGLRDFAYSCRDSSEIQRRFMKARLPRSLRHDLRSVLQQVRGPLAVRSSSVLEDSALQPFAGIYSTFMLSNQADSADQRLDELTAAVKMVYASTFNPSARAYLDRTPHTIDEEKMAVIVQRLVGRAHGRRFYPRFAGIAQSLNHYPIGKQKPEDGVALVALGLGRIVVDGGQGLRFSPAHPKVVPQLSTPRRALQQTQKKFWALDLDKSAADLLQTGEESTLGQYGLAEAEQDGTLGLVGATYVAADDMVREGLHHQGTRLITFQQVLHSRRVPVPTALGVLLEVASRGMGTAVEMEFAFEYEGPDNRPTLYTLQLRPMASVKYGANIKVDHHPAAACAVKSAQALGTGVIDNTYDWIYVKPEAFDPAKTREIASEVGEFNRKLAGHPYILMGPGRWGSSDHWLGIPVDWSQISSVQAIVEVSLPNFRVDPSQGAHFFQNITSMRVGYLTVGLPLGDANIIDWAWLDSIEAVEETGFLRHIRAEYPFRVEIDGVAGQGVVLKPTAPKPVSDPLRED